MRRAVVPALVVAAVVAVPGVARAQSLSVTVSDSAISQTILTANVARAKVTDPAGGPVPNGTPVQFHINGPAGVFTDIGPVVDMRPTPQGDGYWLVTVRGQVLPFGAARSFGDVAGGPIPAPIAAMAPTPAGDGYWLVDDAGKVYPFGSASSLGSAPVPDDE